MEPTIAGIIGIVVMLLLFMTRMPVAYVMTLVGFVGFSLLTSWKGGLSMLARSFYETFASYPLSTIPMFILMGQLAFNSGISRRLYDTAYKFFGHVRGGLAMATVSACTAFGAVCGSSPATAATMATVSIPEMKRFRYSESLATGCVAASGSLGMIMPPSVVLLIYGVLTQQPIGALFVSGILPAFLLTILFILAVAISCRFKPEAGPQGERSDWGQRLRSLTGLLDTIIIFVLVIGGMFLGWFTANEAASIGVLGILALSLIKRQLTWKAFVASLHETLRSSCMILFLVAGAGVFGKFLAVTRIPFSMAGWVAGFELPAFVIMAMIIAIYFLGGCIMDSLAMIMLTIPIFYPVVMGLGYDPIWFGVIIVLVTEMGVITPPVGINVFVVYGVCKKSSPQLTLEDVFKGAFPFLAALIVGIILIIAFPRIALILPNLMN